MRQTLLIISIIALVAVLALLNNSIHKAAPMEHEAETPPPAQTPKAGSTAKTPPLSAEETIGIPAKAKFHFTVGWHYDAANQADPSQLTQSLDEARQFARANEKVVSMEIADLDVPAANRSRAARAVTALGVMLNGKPLLNLTNNPGEGTTNPDYIRHELPAVTHL